MFTGRRQHQFVYALSALLLSLPLLCCGWIISDKTATGTHIGIHKNRSQHSLQLSKQYNKQLSNVRLNNKEIVRFQLHAQSTNDGLENVTELSDDEVDFDTLIDMDVVIYSHRNPVNSPNGNGGYYLGAVQEDGSLSPLSAWTTEYAFGTSLEFLVDENERFSLVRKLDDIRIHYLVKESELSYGSRQCHRGVGNPHGEESEQVYYVEETVVSRFNVNVILNPELEVLW